MVVTDTNVDAQITLRATIPAYVRVQPHVILELPRGQIDILPFTATFFLPQRNI